MVIEFEMSKDGYILRDALHFADNDVPSQDVIETMKRMRFDRWYESVTNPPIVADSADGVDL